MVKKKNDNVWIILALLVAMWLGAYFFLNTIII